MRISDWSSDVCSSDLRVRAEEDVRLWCPVRQGRAIPRKTRLGRHRGHVRLAGSTRQCERRSLQARGAVSPDAFHAQYQPLSRRSADRRPKCCGRCWFAPDRRSEEHTSELQSLMRISYAVFCLKKKTNKNPDTIYDTI